MAIDKHIITKEWIAERELEDSTIKYVESKIIDKIVKNKYKGFNYVGYEGFSDEISIESYEKLQGVYEWYIKTYRKRTKDKELYEESEEGTKYNIKIYEDSQIEIVYSIVKKEEVNESIYIVLFKGVDNEFNEEIHCTISLDEIQERRYNYDTDEEYREGVETRMDLKDRGFLMDKFREDTIKNLELLGEDSKTIDYYANKVDDVISIMARSIGED